MYSRMYAIKDTIVPLSWMTFLSCGCVNLCDENFINVCESDCYSNIKLLKNFTYFPDLLVNNLANFFFFQSKGR